VRELELVLASGTKYPCANPVSHPTCLVAARVRDRRDRSARGRLPRRGRRRYVEGGQLALELGRGRGERSKGISTTPTIVLPFPAERDRQPVKVVDARLGPGSGFGTRRSAAQGGRSRRS
jgi:hypothetical protein